EVGAGSVIAVLVGGEDVFDLPRIQADRGQRRPFALEGEAGMPFDEDVAVGRFDEALPAEIAFNAAAGDLPVAGGGRRGAGGGGPGFGRLGNFLVQVGLPQLLTVHSEFENRAPGLGREELAAV